MKFSIILIGVILLKSIVFCDNVTIMVSNNKSFIISAAASTPTLETSFQNTSISSDINIDISNITTSYIDDDHNNNVDDDENTVECVDGLLLPVWMPQKGISVGTRIFRGVVYFLVLCYLFLGVSIVCDSFMASIQVITSQEKKVKVKKSSGLNEYINVRIWNGTVANLSLMALGTSAPEILLSIIEVFSKGFEAGALGPGTIVGSAAYNLFCITALCVFVVPDGQVKKIKFFRVFIITTTFSVFAYIWLYLILAQFSPGRIEVWEGFITFIMFPLTVYFAYVADKRLFFYKYISKEYRRNRRGEIMIKTEITDAIKINSNERMIAGEEENLLLSEVKEFEETRREYIATLLELREQFPHKQLEDLEVMAQEQLINKGLKSRAFYRIQATHKMWGGSNLLKKISERAHLDLIEVKSELLNYPDINNDDNMSRIYFDPAHYSVMENCGSFEVKIIRRGNISTFVTVQYETEEGSAEADTDFISKRGTLVFLPGICEQRLIIDIIDNDIFEQDEHFYVNLTKCSTNAILSTPKIATIMILDNDHSGIFGFSVKEHLAKETDGKYELKVHRYSGVRGKVIVPFWAENGTAKAGKDYEPLNGELIFDTNETEYNLFNL